MMIARIRTQRHAEPIGVALGLLPSALRERLAHVQFLAGVDPLFAGLHRTEVTEDGRSYRTTAHVCFPYHLTHRPRAEQVTTVVVPDVVAPWVIVHELGHALHETLDFDTHDPEPVTAYAQTNRWEAFAEAFTAWLCPDVYTEPARLLAADQQTLALFDSLAGAEQRARVGGRGGVEGGVTASAPRRLAARKSSLGLSFPVDTPYRA